MAKGEEEGQIDGCVHSRGWRKGVRMECLASWQRSLDLVLRIFYDRVENEHRGQRILC